MFSSNSFIVSSLTFRSLIHFEFVFVYGVRVYCNFTDLHMAVQFFQYHLLYFSHSFLHCKGKYLSCLTKQGQNWADRCKRVERIKRACMCLIKPVSWDSQAAMELKELFFSRIFGPPRASAYSLCVFLSTHVPDTWTLGRYSPTAPEGSVAV